MNKFNDITKLIHEATIGHYAKHYGISEDQARESLFGNEKPKVEKTKLDKVIVNEYTENRIKEIEKTLNELNISIRNEDDSYRNFSDVLSDISDKLHEKQ